ncbi:hypothetical protein Ddye_000381 [Dipteronia dyeriana]|uniref:Tf2-1-like SH3-like domain-containing protein n=1 Tax=Dipteronia dyeriana TaxID=168575 RepID=A0AAD9XM01_9ROSI|nr:hypothetical protein Ddye_000381 [Dipteronia dyeriana]
MSTFEAIYGVHQPSVLSYVPGITKIQAVDDLLRSRDDILRDLRHNLQPYRQKSVSFHSSLKLAPRYYGPYKVLARIGKVVYRLDLPAGSKIHNVFHVSQLKKKWGPIDSVEEILPTITNEDILLPRHMNILDRGVVQKGKYRPKTEVLIHWSGAPAEDASWENLWRLSKTYPEFSLGDKEPLRVEE